jgi:hypothetical protein
VFPSSRFRSVGATGGEIMELEAQFEELAPQEQASEEAALAQVDNVALAGILERYRAHDVYTVDDVDLLTLTRAELDEYAKSVGVENPAKLLSKAAVLEAIALAESAGVAGDDVEAGEGDLNAADGDPGPAGG